MCAYDVWIEIRYLYICNVRRMFAARARVRATTIDPLLEVGNITYNLLSVYSFFFEKINLCTLYVTYPIRSPSERFGAVKIITTVAAVVTDGLFFDLRSYNNGRRPVVVYAGGYPSYYLTYPIIPRR